ncbi:MAG: iron-containing alcohol dehydrogenase [Sandaracinaceae bacterium]
MTAQLVLPRHTLIGAGAVTRIAALLERLDVQRPLVVTDPFMRDSGMVEAVTGPLKAAGLEVGLFADTVSDPTDRVVEQGAAALTDGGFDGMVAFGGGSPIDTAKAMAILAANGGKMRDYKAPNPIPKAGPPLFAVPTTAGTGSEVTRFTIVTDLETDEKMLIAGPSLVPSGAIVDFELTMKLPPRLTADTGIDALVHAIEAYVSRKKNPVAAMYAKDAMGRIARHLRAAYREPDNREARAEMMLGATHAGIAFSTSSVALVHGMSRPIGAHFHVHHGLSNAMLFPAVTAFSIPEDQAGYADCARFMGVATTGDPDEVAVAKLLDELRALNRDLDVPTPKAYGIDAEKYRSLLPLMADQAIASGSPGNNPRVPDAAQIISIYEEIYA